MRLHATLLLCLLAGPAIAESCEHWTASMEEDEGGPRMMASICTGPDASRNILLVQCAADGELNLRFLPGPAIDYPPNAGAGDLRAELKFTINQRSFRQTARYEDMDGAMAMYVPIKDDLIQAMMKQESVTLTDMGGQFSAISFPLKNAGDALGRVIDACGK